MKKNSILYVGNDLVKKTNYNTSMAVLTKLLCKEGFYVLKTSKKQNKILRLSDMCFYVLKNIKKVDYILIDTFSTSNFYFAFFTSQIARLFKLKYIPILRGGDLPNRLDNSIKLSKMIFKNSYFNIAPSGYLEYEFNQRGYMTKFIPNILEIDNYIYKERKIISPKILWVRAFKELYNPKLAIKVLSIIKEKYPNAKLCMVGPNNDESFTETQKLVTTLSLDNSVEFTGVLPKEEWHKKAIDFDLFINTTNFDNTPVSVMEAMALGLVVISTNVGGLPYLINNKVDGFLVDKDDEVTMSDVIITLLEHQNHLEIVKNARKKAESFGWNIVKHEWLSILK
ncbi:glycosyltransferase family 4 protein [Polaribacter uvawellassae]|uniref:glycosyltransferase family 4 protein n=1 Tax=Polaribacter uvawellassae TaxID=3133495 RepID=UPI00321C26CB